MDSTSDTDQLGDRREAQATLADETKAAVRADQGRGHPMVARILASDGGPDADATASDAIPGLWYPGTSQDPSLPFDADDGEPSPELPARLSAAEASPSQPGRGLAGWLALTVAIAVGGWAIGLGGVGLAVALGSQVRLPARFELPFFAFAAVVSVLVGTAIIGRIVGVRSVVEWVWALALVSLVNFLWGSFIPLWLVMID